MFFSGASHHDPDVIRRAMDRQSPKIVQCYMCFDDTDTPDNPLVAPCQCKGGTRYVHIECLQRWQCSSAEDKVRPAEKPCVGGRCFDSHTP